jgi:hypothetical protein
MMINNDVCLLEFVGEVEEDQQTNITFNVFALSVTITMSLSDVENIHVHPVTNFVYVDVEVM